MRRLLMDTETYAPELQRDPEPAVACAKKIVFGVREREGYDSAVPLKRPEGAASAAQGCTRSVRRTGLAALGLPSDGHGYFMGRHW